MSRTVLTIKPKTLYAFIITRLESIVLQRATLVSWSVDYETLVK